MRKKTQCMYCIICFSFFIVLIIPPPSTAFADVAIISNKAMSEKNLTKDEIKDIFLGKIVKWKNGSKINIVILKNNHDVNKEFTTKYIGKSTDQFEKWWRRMLFTGKGIMPKSFESNQAMIEYIKGTEGAVGYVDKNSVTDDVQVIDIN